MMLSAAMLARSEGLLLVVPFVAYLGTRLRSRQVIAGILMMCVAFAPGTRLRTVVRPDLRILSADHEHRRVHVSLTVSWPPALICAASALIAVSSEKEPSPACHWAISP
jgi:ABC-type uncharacterized transport system permease subunit